MPNLTSTLVAGETLCLPTVLLHRKWWSVRDSRPGNKPTCHPVTPQEAFRRCVLISDLFLWDMVESVDFALISSPSSARILWDKYRFCLTIKIICVICAGIHSVVFDEQCQHILAMCSLEGEIVPLRQSVHISSLVEVKLLFCMHSQYVFVAPLGSALEFIHFMYNLYKYSFDYRFLLFTACFLFPRNGWVSCQHKWRKLWNSSCVTVYQQGKRGKLTLHATHHRYTSVTLKMYDSLIKKRHPFWEQDISLKGM